MKNILILAFSFFLNLSVHATEFIQYDLRVDGMTCPFCLAASEKALKELEGVELVNSNLDTATIKVCGPVSLELDELELTELFANTGFTYRSAQKLSYCSLTDNDNLEDIEHSVDHSEHHGEH